MLVTDCRRRALLTPPPSAFKTTASTRPVLTVQLTGAHLQVVAGLYFYARPPDTGARSSMTRRGKASSRHPSTWRPMLFNGSRLCPMTRLGIDWDIASMLRSCEHTASYSRNAIVPSINGAYCLYGGRWGDRVNGTEGGGQEPATSRG